VNERTRIRIGRGLLGLGMLLAGVWAAVTIDAGAFQARLASRLAALAPSERPRAGIAVARATRREAVTTGLIGRIEAPRLGLSAMVVEGVGGRALRHGVGHVPRTAFPGEPGNVALAGHRDTYFRALKDVVVGDRITLRTPDGAFSYRVDSVGVVKPSRADLLDPTASPRLTLVTCYPIHYVGPAPLRLVVVARPEFESAVALAAPAEPR
jgi:sortase A